MNYVLIGMPGSGKSTLGVLLAKYLGFSFLDTDLVIQNKESKLLREIIEEKGTDGFLRIEDDIGSGIHVDRTVIATGGSMVMGEAAMKNYRENGKIIYLSIPFEEMERRLANEYRRRGVVLLEGQTLLDMYNARYGLPLRQVTRAFCPDTSWLSEYSGIRISAGYHPQPGPLSPAFPCTQHS